MVLKIGLVLLALWVVGIVGVYDIGDAVHVFLLVGFMLSLLGFLRARDAEMAMRRRPEEPPARR